MAISGLRLSIWLRRPQKDRRGADIRWQADVALPQSALHGPDVFLVSNSGLKCCLLEGSTLFSLIAHIWARPGMLQNILGLGEIGQWSFGHYGLFIKVLTKAQESQTEISNNEVTKELNWSSVRVYFSYVFHLRGNEMIRIKYCNNREKCSASQILDSSEQWEKLVSIFTKKDIPLARESSPCVLQH